MQESKKCPFCGGADYYIEEIREINPIYKGNYRAICSYCGATAPRKETIEATHTAWDKRFKA